MLSNCERAKLKIFACEIRKKTLCAMHGIGGGHIGGSMSIAEALAVLYSGAMNIDPANPRLESRDRLVLSKGHCGAALYAALALKGFFPLDELPTMNAGGTRLPSHVDRLKTPGVDFSGGSLGNGLSVAVGSAVGARVMGKDYHTYCIVGDGECDEGQIWEAALFAAHHAVDNLTLLVDSNKQQLDGYIEDICGLENLADKFRAFNWQVYEVDGHDVAAVREAVGECRRLKGKPGAIILNTVKGKGCGFAERKGLCHYMTVSDEDYEKECAALDCEIEKLRAEAEA